MGKDEVPQNPNEVLFPFYEGDEIIYITPPEYYARIGKVVIQRIEEE